MTINNNATITDNHHDTNNQKQTNLNHIGHRKKHAIIGKIIDLLKKLE